MKESSDSEPRRGAGESPRREREVGGYKKNWTPRSTVFSSRFARARISLNCKRALPCSGRRCVCAKASLVSAGAPRHGRERETTQAIVQQHTSPLRAVTCVEVNARVVLRCACLCFWRALGQSTQAEQDTLILCSKQESVLLVVDSRPSITLDCSSLDPCLRLSRISDAPGSGNLEFVGSDQHHQERRRCFWLVLFLSL